MAAVKRGGNRQDLHERIRVHSQEAARQVKEFGLANDLLERISKDSVFAMDMTVLNSNLDPALYVGRSAEQTDEFLSECVAPALARWNDWKNLGEEKLRV